MRTFLCFSAVSLTLGLITCWFFIIRDTENGYESSLHYRTPGFTSKIEPQLGNEENRCEGKIHTSPVSQELTLRQYARKKRVHGICSTGSSLDIKSKWQTFDEIPQAELSNLLVDDRHGIIYCYVPKAACTAWRRIMIILSESLKVHGVPYKDPADIPIQLVHGSSLQLLKAYPKEVIKQKLETYTKFLFVRNPFVRLISAYREKFETKNEFYYKTIGVQILRRFQNISNPPISVEEAHKVGIVPSFCQFIEYILSFPAKDYILLDVHWRQTYHLCHPCLIDYDFIGKVETILEDAAHLFRMLHVDNIVSLQQSEVKTWARQIKDWFANIPVEWRRKLYQVYEKDFKLFGYEDHENLDDLDDEDII